MRNEGISRRCTPLEETIDMTAAEMGVIKTRNK